MAALLAVVGRKGSGKAEILARLINLLSGRGLRVGVIKHLAREDFEIDEPGKDTFQYRAEGAQTVMLAGRQRLAVFSNLEREMPLEDLLAFFRDFDLVFLEGYFCADVATLEVYKRDSRELLLTERARNLLAICSEEETGRDVPHFSPGELDSLASLIEAKILAKEAEVSS